MVASSISFALHYHVDKVFALLHRDTASSRQGFAKLQEIWGGRLVVLELSSAEYWQEATSNAFLQIVQGESPDWIYFFDADEFLLSDAGDGLRQVLSGLDPSIASIRYEVQNWVATTDFDETSMEQYERLVYRSLPNLFLIFHPWTMRDEIKAGNINIFDIQFIGPKVIFRNSPEAWISAGAHLIRPWRTDEIIETPCPMLRAAHFPFLSYRRLGLRANQGKSLIEMGFPEWHGWQSQMIHELLESGEIDGFWESHSIAPDASETGRSRPSIIVDESFSNAIRPIIRLLEENGVTHGFRFDSEGYPELQSFGGPATSFETLVQFARKTQLILESMEKKRYSALMERDAIISSLKEELARANAVLMDRDVVKASLNEGTARVSSVKKQMLELGKEFVKLSLLVFPEGSAGHRLLKAIKRMIFGLFPKREAIPFKPN